MVLKTDQERIKALLKDTITLLCRNGLSFKTEFAVEALIGITLDKDDVFLVSINEIIRTELGAKLAAAEEAASSEPHPAIEGDTWGNESDGSQHGSPHNRKRRRKRRRSSEKGSQGSEDDGAGHVAGEEGSGASLHGAADDSSNYSEPPQKMAATNMRSVKQERHEEEEEDRDIVFIKEELEDSWASTSAGGAGDSAYHGDISAMASTSQGQDNFSDFLQGGSLVPVGQQHQPGGPQGGANYWGDMSQHGGPNQAHMAKRTSSTVTSDTNLSQADDSQQILRNTHSNVRKTYQSVPPVGWKGFRDSVIFGGTQGNSNVSSTRDHTCPLCELRFGSELDLKDHNRSVHGPGCCCPCGMVFKYRMQLKRHKDRNMCGLFPPVV